MAKKTTKKQFDWKTYSRPVRLLSESQESALAGALLAPLLQLVSSDPLVRLDVRARSANLYYRGSLAMRITGEEPCVAEFESAAEGGAERIELHSPPQVAEALERLESMRQAIDRAWDVSARSERDYLQAIAEANSGLDLFASDYIIIDIEYSYGRRRYDMIALQRVEGVTGPGGFAHARLAFVDVRCCGQSLGGASGLEAVGGDYAEFTKALGGSHLERTRLEFSEMVRQKVRLGLLPTDLEIRQIEPDLPELLVLFAEYDVTSAAHDAAIIALHEKLASRHYPTELLRFAVLPEVRVENASAAQLREEQLMTYRQFKEYRSRERR